MVQPKMSMVEGWILEKAAWSLNEWYTYSGPMRQVDTADDNTDDNNNAAGDNSGWQQRNNVNDNADDKATTRPTMLWQWQFWRRGWRQWWYKPYRWYLSTIIFVSVCVYVKSILTSALWKVVFYSHVACGKIAEDRKGRKKERKNQFTSNGIR